jgi:hypothetical protein
VSLLASLVIFRRRTGGPLFLGPPTSTASRMGRGPHANPRSNGVRAFW